MKRKISHNLILLLCVVALVVLCVLSVSRPMRFDRQRTERERSVETRLLQIRQAQERYRQAHGTYAPHFDQLVKGRYLADSLQYIPFGQGKRFALSTTTMVSKSGKSIPLMECGATYAEYLQGLDDEAVQRLTEQALQEGRYPGLKIGDLTTDNDNAGNW